MAKTGPKSKYTPETVDKILNAIAVGAPYVHACGYAGISQDTFERWRAQHTEFAEAIKNAEGRAVVGWLAKIEKAASEGNWQAVAWKLERRYHEHFGRKDKVQIDVNKLDADIERELAAITAGSEAAPPTEAQESIH